MSIRKLLNGSPALTVVFVLVVLGVCGWVIYGQVKQTGTLPPESAFYTVDDGKTWFVDSNMKLTPFDHEGKQAVRARMFRCADSEERFVGYLERYSAKGKALVEKNRVEQAAKPGQMPASFGELASLGPAVHEMKKPGESKWLTGGSGEAMALQQMKCKDGAPAYVVEAD